MFQLTKMVIFFYITVFQGHGWDAVLWKFIIICITVESVSGIHTRLPFQMVPISQLALKLNTILKIMPSNNKELLFFFIDISHYGMNEK